MGHQTCPTVAIQGEPSEGNPSGIVVIDESDFDATTMTKCEMPAEPVVEVVPTEQTDATVPKIVAPWAAN